MQGNRSKAEDKQEQVEKAAEGHMKKHKKKKKEKKKKRVGWLNRSLTSSIPFHSWRMVQLCEMKTCHSLY